MASHTKIVELSLSVIIAGVFCYAGVIKLLHPDLLLQDIQSYNLVSYRVAYLGAYYLPALEIVAGLGLLLRSFRMQSAILLGLLNVVFIIALASAWIRGLDISCGCFGKSEIEVNYPWFIGRDTLLLAACVLIVRQHNRTQACCDASSSAEA